YTGRSLHASFWLVIFIADAIAASALMLMPHPVIQFMGGIRLTETEIALCNIAMLATTATIVTFPIWLIGASVVFFRRPKTPAPQWDDTAGFALGPIALPAA